jgi:hypothetical protein
LSERGGGEKGIKREGNRCIERRESETSKGECYNRRERETEREGDNLRVG